MIRSGPAGAAWGFSGGRHLPRFRAFGALLRWRLDACCTGDLPDVLAGVAGDRSDLHARHVFPDGCGDGFAYSCAGGSAPAGRGAFQRPDSGAKLLLGWGHVADSLTS